MAKVQYEPSRTQSLASPWNKRSALWAEAREHQENFYFCLFSQFQATDLELNDSGPFEM